MQTLQELIIVPGRNPNSVLEALQLCLHLRPHVISMWEKYEVLWKFSVRRENFKEEMRFGMSLRLAGGLL